VVMIELTVSLKVGLKVETKNFSFDPSGDFVSQFKSICNLFALPDVVHEKHCLLTKAGKYIIPDKNINPANVFSNVSVC
jgi:hypothetical protein